MVRCRKKTLILVRYHFLWEIRVRQVVLYVVIGKTFMFYETQLLSDTHFGYPVQDKILVASKIVLYGEFRL